LIEKYKRQDAKTPRKQTSNLHFLGSWRLGVCICC
jgi:hypothetical protein